MISEALDALADWIDLAGWGVLIGVIFDVLPQVTVVLAILWYVLRIYESDTVQRWLGRKGE